jgi:hypothetical protein
MHLRGFHPMKKGSVACPRPTRVPKGKERGEMYTRGPAKLQRCFRAYMTERPCGASDRCRKIREAERDPMHPRGYTRWKGLRNLSSVYKISRRGDKEKGERSNQK